MAMLAMTDRISSFNQARSVSCVTTACPRAASSAYATVCGRYATTLRYAAGNLVNRIDGGNRGQRHVALQLLGQS